MFHLFLPPPSAGQRVLCRSHLVLLETVAKILIKATVKGEISRRMNIIDKYS